MPRRPISILVYKRNCFYHILLESKKCKFARQDLLSIFDATITSEIFSLIFTRIGKLAVEEI